VIFNILPGTNFKHGDIHEHFHPRRNKAVQRNITNNRQNGDSNAEASRPMNEGETLFRVITSDFLSPYKVPETSETAVQVITGQCSKCSMVKDC